MNIYLKLALTAVMWGGAFVTGRVAVQHVGAFTAAFGRFAIATLVLVLWSYGHRERLTLERSQWLPAFALGFAGVFAYNAFFFLALKTVAAGRAALVVALNPAAIAVGAAMFFGDALSGLKIAGIGLSLCGAAIVITQGDLSSVVAEGVGIGELALLGCVVSWVVYTLLGRWAMKYLTPTSATTWACGTGTVMLAVPALIEGAAIDLWRAPPIAWICIVYLGILASAACFIWYYEGVQAIGPAKAAVFINLVPVSAIALGAIFLQEPISPAIALGGALVVTGVYATNRA
ncbi:MAG: DMT family transporter [Cyanobacteria bacterium J06639_1]